MPGTILSSGSCGPIRPVEQINTSCGSHPIILAVSAAISLAATIPADPVQAISSLQAENAELKKELEALRRQKAAGLKDELKQEIRTLAGARFLARKVDLDAGAMKDLVFQLGGEVDDLFLLLASEHDGKALLTCYISKDLATARGLNAGTIVRELGRHIQGGGGGQPFFATAGGKNPAGIAQALEAAEMYLQG